MMVNKLPKILIIPMAIVELCMIPPIKMAPILKIISVAVSAIAVPCREAISGKLERGEAMKLRKSHGNNN